jgi:hypothetical protein
MKIIVSGFDAELLALYSSGAMNAATPQTGLPVRRINTYSKPSLPAVPRRGPAAGVLRTETIFMIPV